MALPRPEEIGKLPQSLGKRWRKSLGRLPSFKCDTPHVLSMAKSQGELLKSSADGDLDIGCLSDSEWRQLGLPEGVQGTTPAVCRAMHCDQVPIVREARRMATRPIPRGTTPSQLWKERFERLCARCKLTVVIVDRYSLGGTRWQRDASEFLLNRLLECLPESCSVQWFAHHSEGIGIEFDRLRTIWTRTRRQGSLELFSPKDQMFVEHCHHRFIRFDHWLCIMDTGVEVFAQEITKLTTFHFRGVTEDDRHVEETLRQGGRRWC